MMRIAIFLQRNLAPNTHEETCPAERPPSLRGFWLSIEFAYKDDASNDSGFLRMRRWIRLSPQQPAPSPGWQHPHFHLSHKAQCWSMAASLASLNVSLK